MATIAKISTRSGKLLRTVKLHHGRNDVVAEADAVVTVVDEATGRTIDQASMIRHGDAATIVLADFAGSETAGSASLVAAPETAPVPQFASAEMSHGDALAGGNVLLPVLGLLAVGGGIAAAASGKGGSDGSSSNKDTTPPAAPTGLALAAADDTGASNSDRITSQTTALTITGTAEANSSVTLKDGSTTLGTATADSTGKFTVDVALSAGTHNITASAKDAAGNTGPDSTALAITVDTTAPAAPSGLALLAAQDTGVSSSDGVTNRTGALTITGNAEANSSVAIKEGSTTLATGTADASGHFSIDVNLSATGHNLTAVATDVAGNVGTVSSALTVNIDTIAPTLTVASSNTALLGPQTATITFTFSETPVGFTASDVTVSNGTISAFTATADPKVYTATLTPAATGTVTVTVATGTFSDVAGNASTTPFFTTVSYDAGSGGSAIDGYVSNARVYRDSNGNGVFDAGEFNVVTDAQGNFTGLFGTGAIVLEPILDSNGKSLSIDIATGKEFTGHYSAPDGSTVVTPLTTIVQALVANGASASDAQAQVKAALGVSAGVDLATFDPLAAATDPATAADAVGAQKAAIQVANILSVVATAASAAGAGDGGKGAIDAAASSIATQIANNGAVDLSKAEVVQQVVQHVASQSGDSNVAAALNTQSSGISQSLANVNDAVQQASGASVSDTFAAIITAQIVAQQTLGNDVTQAITNNTTLDSGQYSGSDLADKIDTAATQVETVLPATPPAAAALETPDRPVVDPAVGTRVSGTEAAANVGVTVSWTGAGGAKAGDTLRLYMGDGVAKSYVLQAGDIPASGATGSHVFTLTAADLGADGAKSLTAEFIAAAGTEGARSFPLVLTLDTSSPTPTLDVVSGGYINAAEAAGNVSGTFSGVEVGASTVVRVSGTDTNGHALAANLASNGRTFTLDAATLAQFADGTLTISATQTDPTGNVSATGSGTVILDRTVGTATLALAASDDSGRSNSDGVTSQTSGLTISGSAEAGTTVTIRDGGTVVGAGTVAGNGTYSIDIALAQGTHAVTAQVTDAAGNIGAASSPLTITIDTTAPAAPAAPTLDHADDTGISNSDLLTNKTSGLTITGTAEANSTVTIREGAAVLGTGLADGSGLFSIDIGLAAGTHSLTATATDAAGNSSPASTAVTIDVDTGAPIPPLFLTLSSLDDTGDVTTDRLTSQTTALTITGNGEPNTSVVLMDGATQVGAGTIDAGGAFSIDIALAEGVHSITAVLTDRAGNTGTASTALVITVDTTAPAAPTALALDSADDTGRSDSDGVTASGAGVTITGTSEANAIITLKEGSTIVGSGRADGTGHFSFDLSVGLSEGTHALTATATDLAGNTGTASGPLSITVDNTPPAVPSGLALDAADDDGASHSDRITTLHDGLTITGTAEANAIVTLRENLPGGVVVLGTGTANGSGHFSIDISLGEGTHSLGAVATDVAGNSDIAFEALSITVDNTAPAAPTGLALAASDDTGNSDSDRITSQTSGLTITGSAEANSTIVIKEGATVLGTGTADSFGAFVIDISLGAGSHSLTASAADAAGNAGAASSPLAITVDTTAPAAPSGLALAAADDTGNSDSDRLTSLNTFLTITGNAEAGSAVVLKEGATVLGSGTADGGGHFSIDITLAEGAHSLNATATDAAGNSNIAVGALAITVDDTAPATPTVQAAEGPRLTALTAADGTTFTGTAETGSAVSLVLHNGANSLSKTAVASGGAFSIALSQAEIAALGEGTITYAATATDGAGNVSAASAQGQLVYTTATVTDSGRRIDTPAAPLSYGDQTEVKVTPVAGGGLITSWTIDANGDGDGESIAIQRFAADGSKLGDVIVLHDLPPVLEDHIGDIGSYDLAPLANGGFVLGYSLDLPQYGHGSVMGDFVTASSVTRVNTVALVGTVHSVDVSQAVAGVTFQISGLANDGSRLSVPVTPVNGHIEITQAILDQFSNDSRLSLVASGIPAFNASNPAASSFVVSFTALQDVAYDPAGATTTSAVTGVNTSTAAGALTINSGTLLSTTGRVEAFHVNAPTLADPATLPNGFPRGSLNMSITPIGGNNLDITGITGAQLRPNGQVSITLAAAADGNYAVPQAILDQLGTRDANITLTVLGIAAGSSVTGTITVRGGTAIPAGVFTQAFDATGAATGTPSAALDSATGTHHALLDDGGVHVSSLANGGYAVHWTVDANGDGEGDTVAFARFAADGTPQGAALPLTNLDPRLLANSDQIGSVDVEQLSDGRFALAYSVELPWASRSATLNNTSQAAQTLTFSMVGIPQHVVVSSAPAGVTYALVGVGSGGSPINVPLSVVDGELQITREVLAQFATPDRLTIQAIGIPAQSSVTLSVLTGLDQHYDRSASLHDIAGSSTNAAGGIPILFAQTGRAEAFHVTSVPPAAANAPNGQVGWLLVINSPTDPASFNLTGTGGFIGGGQIIIPVSLDSGGNVAVPAAILNQLGSRDFSAVLVASGAQAGSTITGTVSIRDAIANPEGVFVQTFDANGVGQTPGATRIDTGLSHFSYSENAKLGITPQAGGGYVVHWVTDTNNNVSGDGIALQRFAADGTKVGDVVTLEGINQQIIESRSEVNGYDVTVLDNGQYALSFGADAPLAGKVVTLSNTNGAPLGLTLVNRPESIEVISAPGGATWTLAGIGLDGLPHSHALQLVDGYVEVPAAVLAEYQPGGHVSLQIGNVALNQSVSLFVTQAQTLSIAPGTPAHPVVPFTSLNPGSPFGTGSVGVVAATTGRATSFHFNAISYIPGAPHAFVLLVSTPQDAHGYDLSGVSGAVIQPDGTIRVPVGIDGNNNVVVPQALLTALGSDEAQIVLLALAVANGSTFAATAYIQDGTPNLEGVYTQTFDASGHALSTDLTLTGTAGPEQLTGGDGNDLLFTGGGVDVLHAGAGNDHLVVNGTIAAGTVLDGGAGNDTLHLSAAAMDFNAGGQTYIPLFNAQLSGIEHIRFESAAGTQLRAIATVGELTDGTTIHGGAGNDMLIISAGPDAGTYTMPQLTYANWQFGNDVVVLTAGDPNSTNAINLNVSDHPGFIVVAGNAGANVIVGNNGAEIINGGAGADTLTGRGGADTFVLENPHGQTLSTTDLITDFTVGADKMQVGGGLTFADLTIAQGDPGTNGAAATDTLVMSTLHGDILARLANVDATTVTAASFQFAA